MPYAIGVHTTKTTAKEAEAMIRLLRKKKGKFPWFQALT